MNSRIVFSGNDTNPHQIDCLFAPATSPSGCFAWQNGYPAVWSCLSRNDGCGLLQFYFIPMRFSRLLVSLHKLPLSDKQFLGVWGVVSSAVLGAKTHSTESMPM